MYEFNGNPNNLLSHMVSKEENINHIQHLYDINELIYQICEEEINRIVPPLCEKICTTVFNEAVNSIMRAFEYDIHSVYEISFKDLEAMFRSEKARRFVSDAVIKEVKKNLKNIHLDFKL